MKHWIFRFKAYFLILLFLIPSMAAAQTLPLPSGQEIISHAPVILPVVDANASDARAVGLGSVIVGGSTVRVQIALDQFAGSMHVYGAFTLSSSPDTVNVLNPDGVTFNSFTLNQISNTLVTGVPPAGALPWKSNTAGPVDETLFSLPAASAPPGTYTVYLLATPDNFTTYYLWVTTFTVPGPACTLTAEEQDMLDRVNNARSTSRMCGNDFFAATGALTWDCDLKAAAINHSNDMSSNDFFDHTGTGDSTVGTRATDMGYVWLRVGENIAAGFTTVPSVVQGWLDSPDHCSNIMNPDFTQLGTGKASDAASTFGTYWTQVFGNPLN